MRIVTVDGVNKSGKSTFIRALRDELERSDVKVTVAKTPQWVIDTHDHDVIANNLENLISVSDCDVLVVDRFALSHLVYNHLHEYMIGEIWSVDCPVIRRLVAGHYCDVIPVVMVVDDIDKWRDRLDETDAWWSEDDYLSLRMNVWNDAAVKWLRDPVFVSYDCINDAVEEILNRTLNLV